MPRKIETLSRLLLTVFVVAAAIGCESDKEGGTPDQLVGGVSPTFLFLDVRASRNAINANEAEHPIVVTVEARFADTGLPLADGTLVNLSASLGGFDTPGGTNNINLELFNGTATINYYPGATAGVARIRAALQGVLDQVLITIRPDPDAGPPPDPAPTASTITMSADTTTVFEGDAETEILVEATVLGSDAEPFRNGPVQFSSPTGEFLSSGTTASAVLATDSNGQVFDALTVFGPDLEAFAGNSFNITATLFLEGGATTTSTVTITIVRADDPPTPTSIVLNTSPTTAADDGSPHDITLTATVRDQNGVVMSGVDVQFNPELGTAAPTTDTTDIAGIATSTLSLTAAEIAAFPSNSFEVEAIMGVTGGTASDTATVTISRPGLTALFSHDGDPDTLAVGGMVVNFTDQSTGGPTSWDWDLDGDGILGDANVPNPTFDYTGHVACDLINVTLVVSNISQTDSAVLQLVVQPCP